METLVDIETLWQKNKHCCWDLWDNNGKPEATITLEEVFYEAFSDITDEFQASLESHCETIAYWRECLASYKNRENEIPEAWAIELTSDDYVEDGNHRLVAAKLEGLTKILAIVE